MPSNPNRPRKPANAGPNAPINNWTPSELLNKEQTCATLQLSKRCLEGLVRTRRLVKGKRFGKHICWTRACLDEFIRREFSVQEAFFLRCAVGPDRHDRYEGPTLSELLTKEQACALLMMSERCLENLVRARRFPPGRRLGRRVYWSRRCVNEFIRAQFGS